MPDSTLKIARPLPNPARRPGDAVWFVTLASVAREDGEWRLTFRVAGTGPSGEVIVTAPAGRSHTWTASRVMDAVRRWVATPDADRPAVLHLREPAA